MTALLPAQHPWLLTPCRDCKATPGQQCRGSDGHLTQAHHARIATERDTFLVANGWPALGAVPAA